MSLYSFMDKEQFDPNLLAEDAVDENSDIFISKKRLKKKGSPSYIDMDTDIWF